MGKVLNLDGSLTPNAESYERIIAFQNACLNNTPDDIKITFKGCKFICPNLLTIIGALPLLGERCKKKIELDLDTIDDLNVRACVSCSGFLNYINPTVEKDYATKNAIKFDRFNINEKDNILKLMTYIYSIIALFPVNMEQQVKDALAGNLYEIFNNAFLHSNSEIGIFGCGYYFSANKVLYFSLYDAGVGVPMNVRNYLNNKNIASDKTLEWAFTLGNSTAKGRDYRGGLGFDLIKDFVMLNGGDASLYSCDANASITKQGVKFNTINQELLGTIFSIRIKSDERKYVMV